MNIFFGRVPISLAQNCLKSYKEYGQRQCFGDPNNFDADPAPYQNCEADPVTDLIKFILFTAKLDGVKTYMRIRKVPSNLQIKVIKWFDYLWLSQKSTDEERAVSCLPGRK